MTLRTRLATIMALASLATGACDQGEGEGVVSDDPRCQMCFDPPAEPTVEDFNGTLPATYVCGDGAVDCGAYYDAPGLDLGLAPEGLPAEICEATQAPSEDCTPLEEYNAQIFSCANDLVASGGSGVIRRVTTSSPSQWLERTLYIQGDGTAFDVDHDTQDLSVTWSATRLIDVPAKAIDACGSNEDAADRWTCLEKAIDAAPTLVECSPAGWYEDLG